MDKETNERADKRPVYKGHGQKQQRYLIYIYILTFTTTYTLMAVLSKSLYVYNLLKYIFQFGGYFHS